MMRFRLSRSLVLVIFVLGSLTLATSASAEEIAGLKADIGAGVDALVRSDIEQTIPRVFEDNATWDYVEPQKARAALNPIVRDCFTDDCLKKAGEATGAAAGLRLEFTGEAQIYDWSIEIFDLASGKLLTQKKGACELCGRSEVTRTFQRSLTDALNSTPVPKKAVTRKTSPTPSLPEPAEPPAEQPPTVATGEKGVEVSIRPQPEDAVIYLGGQKIGTGSTTLTLAPGTHVLRFQREGYQGLEETLVVYENTEKELLMRVHLSRTDPEAVTVAGDTGLVDEMDAATRNTYGLIAMAAGGAAIFSGIYLAAIDGTSACETGAFNECPEVYDTTGAAVTTTLFGTALVGGGLVLVTWDLLAGGTDEEPQEDTVRLAPAFGHDRAGVVVLGQF